MIYLKHPLAGFCAFAVLVLAAVCVRKLALVRTRSMVTYSNLDFLVSAVRPSPWIERGLIAAWCTGGALMALSCADPCRIISTATTGIAAVVCIDTSGSMASTDIAPTRMQAALVATRAFIARLPESARIELVAFSGQASIVLPFTSNRSALEAALRAFPAPNGETAIGDALAVARRSFTPGSVDDVVLLTDGMNNRGRDPLHEVLLLAMQGARTFSVGIGSRRGDIMPGTSERSSFDEGALRAYARMGNGAYRRGKSTATLRSALEHVAEEIGYARRSFDLAYVCAVFGGALIAAATSVALAGGRV